MNDEMLHEEPQEIENWQRGTHAMARNAHTVVVFGDKQVAGNILIGLGGIPALGLYRMISPDGEKPWGIENVECCQTVLIFKTRRSLDSMRSWLARLDREFAAMEKKAEEPTP